MNLKCFFTNATKKERNPEVDAMYASLLYKLTTDKYNIFKNFELNFVEVD